MDAKLARFKESERFELAMSLELLAKIADDAREWWGEPDASACTYARSWARDRWKSLRTDDEPTTWTEGFMDFVESWEPREVLE